MLKVTLANLRAHKRRLVSTFAAVALGVAFLAGVLVQTSTLETSFDRLFDAESASVDAVVRSDETILDNFDETVRARIDAGLVEEVRAVPGVRDAQGDVRGTAAIIDADGDPLGGGGPPQLGLIWIDDPALSPYRLAEGRAPQGTDEVVIDLRSSKDGGLDVGDTTTVLAPEPVTVTIVGTARFDERDSQAGVTAALFSAQGARAHLADGDPLVDRILIDAEPGADQGALVRAVSEVATDGTETISGAAFAEENRSAVDDVMGFLRPTLLSFALIALLVASFSIYNTFTIIVAQRTREAAMLRAIGAGRGQTLRAVLAEALLVGIVASLAGVAMGIGLASVLGAVLGSGGLAPGGSLVIEVGTLALCVTIGTVITVLCAVGPAIKASRVAPIEALRATAIDRSGATRGRLVAGGLLIALGVFFVVRGTAGSAGMAA
ncbi:MAG TPA: FtsX-like permease family protein, partial [Aquihabitans sp.]|nr:FtsX-like permease family protein [Aquihabitans sp.]